jgi:8-oxo-dGTP pyrophosphatase MutT (NUDIX family)
LREETGYVAGTLRHLVKLSPNPSTHGNALHGVLATDIREEGGVSFDPSEDIEVVRLPWREAVDLAMSGGMINAQHIGLLLIGVQAVKGPASP